MSIFDWLFIGLLASAIVVGFLSLLQVLLVVREGKVLKQLKKHRPKQKSKRKKWLRALKQLERKSVKGHIKM